VSALWARAQGRCQQMATSLFRRPFHLSGGAPVISFTFDDFPRSAWLEGGAILKHFGVTGTYYASLGLMGTTAPAGVVFEPGDLQALLDQRHELGCHTFHHCHSWNTTTTAFEHSIDANEAALSRLIPGASFRTFSYPISPPRPRTKRRMAPRFVCCRGGGQTLNIGDVDLNYLRAFFLEKSRNNPEAVKNLIDENRRVGGWLILATHDVCAQPSPFGCTPDFFEEIVQYSIGSGARILPVIEAWEALHGVHAHSNRTRLPGPEAAD